MSDTCRGEADRGRVQVHYVWVPRPSRGAGVSLARILWLVLTLPISFVIVYTATLVVLCLFVQEWNDPPGWVYGLSVLAGIVGAILSIVIWEKVGHARLMRHPPFRTARLAAIARHRDGYTRLPHRFTERLLRQQRTHRIACAKAAAMVPPGHVVVVNRDRGEGAIDPRPNEVPFEPIEVSGGEEQMAWLVDLNVEHQWCGPLEGRKEKSSAEGTSPLRAAWAYVRVYGGIVAVLVMIAFVLFGGGTPEGRLFYMFLLATLVVLALKPLFSDRRWWLVPGGLVCRTHVWGRRRDRVDYFESLSSGLLVDEEAGLAVVRKEMAVRQIECPGWASWAVLAGWISTARRPSTEEVLAFIGPDAVLDHAGRTERRDSARR